MRAVKNRFGAVSELGVFEMTGTRAAAGAESVGSCSWPSGPKNVPGSAVLCTIEGSRPILVEVQALVSASTFGNARRTASGLDHNRLSLLLAVLDKRAGLNLATDDVFVNVAGGMTSTSRRPIWRSSPPSRRACAIARLPPDVVVFGEVGLAGEVRATSQAALRVREAAQLGFTRCVHARRPASRRRRRRRPASTIIGVRTGRRGLDAADCQPYSVEWSRHDAAFLLPRGSIFVARRSSTRPSVIRPIDGHPVAERRARARRSRCVIVAAETRLRDAAVTSLLGGLLGFGVGLWHRQHDRRRAVLGRHRATPRSSSSTA